MAAVVVVGLAIGSGAFALVWVMQRTLIGDLRDVTAVRAAEISSILEAGDEPTLVVGEADEQLVQVLDAGGRVVAASANAEGLAAVADLTPGEAVRVDGVLGDERLIAVAAGADTPGGPLTVVVVRSVDGVAESVQLVSALLAVGGPLLLVLVAVTTWGVVGRALRPVEAIRAEVDAITTSALDRRVPVPGGGDEVDRLARTMNRMLTRLQEQQQRQRRFVSDAAHELRSPLAVIRQHSEVARAHPHRSSLDALTRTVLQETHRLQALVDDLLVISRADEGSMRLARSPVDVDDLVLAEANRLRGYGGLRVDTRAVSSGQVHGDATALARVVRNLLDNAARHARGRVALTLHEDGGQVLLSVEDDGDGIPQTDRDRVFERFVRLDAGRTRDAGGAGLGLALVHDVAAAMGGTVVIEDSALGGARVVVGLPAAGGP